MINNICLQLGEIQQVQDMHCLLDNTLSALQKASMVMKLSVHVCDYIHVHVYIHGDVPLVL